MNFLWRCGDGRPSPHRLDSGLPFHFSLPPVAVVVSLLSRVRIIGFLDVGTGAGVGVVITPALSLGAGSGVVIVLAGPVTAGVRVVGLCPGSARAGIRVVGCRSAGGGSGIRIVAPGRI